MKMGLKTDTLKLSEIGLCLKRDRFSTVCVVSEPILEMDKGTALW